MRVQEQGLMTAFFSALFMNSLKSNSRLVLSTASMKPIDLQLVLPGVGCYNWQCCVLGGEAGVAAAADGLLFTGQAAPPCGKSFHCFSILYSQLHAETLQGEGSQFGFAHFSSWCSSVPKQEDSSAPEQCFWQKCLQDLFASQYSCERMLASSCFGVGGVLSGCRTYPKEISPRPGSSGTLLAWS